MRLLNALLACAGLVAGDAVACGMSGTVVPFEVEGQAGAVDAALPAPAAMVTEIVRGIGSTHANCDDTGLLTVMIDWPRSSYRLREVGFEFDAAGSPADHGIFPQGPVQGQISGRRSEFLFLWRDGAPDQQRFIDLRVDVRAVNARGERGPSTPLVIRVAPGG